MKVIKQGELLMLLVKRDSRSTQEIAASMGVDKSYLPKLYKMETLPRKPLLKAIATFGVSADYFSGKTDIGAGVSEPIIPYVADESYSRLLRENTRLREEVDKLYKLLEHEKSINASLAEALKNLTQKG